MQRLQEQVRMWQLKIIFMMELWKNVLALLGTPSASSADISGSQVFHPLTCTVRQQRLSLHLQRGSSCSSFSSYNHLELVSAAVAPQGPSGKPQEPTLIGNKAACYPLMPASSIRSSSLDYLSWWEMANLSSQVTLSLAIYFILFIYLVVSTWEKK